MTDQNHLELARLVVGTLNLDLDPARIGAEVPLFGDEGLGLDSIDALELALAIHQTYGVEIKSDDEIAVAAFASLDTLASFIAARRPARAAVA